MPAYASVPGIRFRATPVYSEPRELDALARFFYDEVLPREGDLDRLRRLFDLPPRLVDEILADLVRLHFATLDVRSRRIIRVTNPAPQPEFFAAPDVELWQDSLTGAVIRYNDIPRLYRQWTTKERSDALTLERQGDIVLPDFHEIPGARLVGMLRATSPKMAVLVGGAELETLVGRSFLSNETLRIPIRHASIDLGRVVFVHAPELPGLLTRPWSREVNRHLGDSSVSSALTTSPCDGIELTSSDVGSTVLELVRLSNGISLYQQSIATLSECRRFPVPEPVRERFQDARDGLLERIDSIVAVEFASPATALANHFIDLWGRAKRYLLLVVSDANAGLVRALVESLGPPRAWRACLILVESSCAAASCGEMLSRDISPDILHRFTLSELPTVGVCIRDGVDLRLGSLSELMGDAPVTSVTGGNFSADVATRILSHLPASGRRDFLEELFSTAKARTTRRHAMSGGRSELIDACDKLYRLVQDSAGLVRRALERVSPLWEKGGHDQLRSELGGDDAPPTSDLPGLRELEPRIAQLESELDDCAAGKPLPAPLATCYDPQVASPTDLLAEVTRSVIADRRIRSLLITFDSVGKDWDDRTNRWMLTKLLSAECTVTLYLNPLCHSTVPEWDAHSSSVLDKMQTELPHHLLHLRRGPTRIPTALVVDSTFVILGHRTWFDKGGGAEVHAAFEAPHLAAQFCKLAASI